MGRRLVLLACLLGCALAPAAHATLPGGNGRIAYEVHGTESDEAGGSRPYRALVTVNPDARGDFFVRECRADGGGDCSIDYRAPAWSPDGRRLAFDAGRSLALVRPNATGFALLPAVTADDGEPAWSPSGKRLAFSGRRGSRTHVYVVRGNGRGARRIVRRGRAPDWSRRDRIAFERGGSVYVVRPDGRGGRRVARGTDPGWSPSGRSLVLARRDGIYTVGANGRGLRRVVRCRRCSSPAFSPNGKLIVFDRSGLTIVRARNGRRVTTLTRDVSGAISGDGFQSGAPAWQPRR